MKKLNVVKTVNGEKKKGKTEKRVFFSLLLCVCAVVLISSMFASRVEKAVEQSSEAIKSEEIKKEEIKQEIPSVKVAGEQKEEKKEEVPKVEIEAPKTTEEISAPQTQNTEITTITKPLNGEILKMFSDKQPVYSKTMNDWRVHDGIDIRANIGQNVFACAGGVVEDVYEDSKMGMTVIINHGKLKSKYQNLASTNIIEKGKEVKEGETIGIVGDTAQAEIADVSHLHFELIKGKIQQNPEKMFK